MSTSWIITADPRIEALVALGRGSGRAVTVVAVGDVSVVGADSVLSITTDGAPAEAFGADVAAAVDARPGDVILAADRPAERVLAGAVAARLGLPLVTGMRGLDAESVVVARYGGISHETLSLAEPVVVVADGGGIGDGAPVAATDVTTGTGYPLHVVDETKASVSDVDLASATRIVAAGRGVKAVEDLTLVRDLATVLGAEVACSRPLAEGLDWMPTSTYIGVSGLTVTPELYLAVGISGQLQHMVGAQDSHLVVAINSDADAPIFAQSDYGIVGDLYDVVPALTAALR